MEITNENPPWDSENCALLREFFKTPTGQRLIPRLAEQVPSLLDGGDINSILIRSGDAGYAKALQNLLSLTVPAPDIRVGTVDNYPSLEDDVAHNDGQSLLTPK
jgi:hypothetical protein